MKTPDQKKWTMPEDFSIATSVFLAFVILGILYYLSIM